MKPIIPFVAIVSANLLAGWVPAAPAPIPKGPILSISLDRRSYLPYEPILVEWTITNAGDATIHYCAGRPLSNLVFECIDATGRKASLYNPISFDFALPLPRATILPRQAHKAWLDLRRYRGLVGKGEFRIRAIIPFGYTRGGAKPVVVTLRSKEIAFRIAKPTGADAVAVRFIEDNSRDVPVRAGRLPRQAREGAIDREMLRNRWIFPGRSGLLSEILTKTKSARFHAAANFYRGILFANPERERIAIEMESYAIGCRSLHACLTSKESSTYLKGLAAYHLLRCKVAETGPTARKELAKQARALIAEYPATCMALKAKVILENACNPKK